MQNNFNVALFLSQWSVAYLLRGSVLGITPVKVKTGGEVEVNLLQCLSLASSNVYPTSGPWG